MKKAKNLIIFFGILIPILFVNSLVFLLAWSPPTQSPPGGKPFFPLTPSVAKQTKEGALGVQGVLESLAGLLLNTSGSQPTCNASTRGLIRVRQRGTHNYAFDEVVTCVMNQDGGYKWQVASTSFTCGRDFTDVRDSNVYPTKQIGSQCWMTKNLAYLPSVVGPATGSTTVPYYYVYGYDGTDVNTAKAYTREDGGATYNVYNTYGVLYNWPAAMAGDTGQGSQGICPDGWHLPSDAEQHTLDRFLATGTCDPARSGTSDCTPACKSLKSVRTATGTTCTGATHTADHPRWDYHATECGSDISGFNALPGGARLTGGSFDYLGTYAALWSSSPSGANAWRRNLHSSLATVNRSASDQAFGFSVRCLRD